jgi:hypothetical protein
MPRDSDDVIGVASTAINLRVCSGSSSANDGVPRRCQATHHTSLSQALESRPRAMRHCRCCDQKGPGWHIPTARSQFIVAPAITMRLR